MRLHFVKVCIFFVICNTTGAESTYDEVLARDSTLKEMEDKVRTSNRKYFQLEEKLNAYVDMNMELLEELKRQRLNAVKKEEDINLLKQQLNNLQKKVEGLEAAHAKHSQNIDESNADIDNQVLESVDSPKKAPKDEELKRPGRFVLDQGEAVAFHAVVDAHGEQHHYGVNQNLIFETVLLNINSGYKSQHGVFVAPTAGVYLFSTSVLDAGSKPLIHADLVKNGNTLARAYGHGNSGYPEQGSVTVVTKLNAGDQIWVRLSCCADGSITGMRYTSFTGALITLM